MWAAGVALAVLVCSALATEAPVPVDAGEASARSPTAVQEKLNPLADVVKLPATLSFGFGFGPKRNTQPMLGFQPVVPFRLTDDWRVVTRSNLAVIHLPNPDDTTGLGDLDVSFFLTPARTGAWVWGLGPIVEFPTATNTALGTGKWSAGPTGALLYVNGPWVNGILASELWSFAGPGCREDVSLTQIELLLSYTFASNWYVQTNPTFSDDWKLQPGKGWLVPIGIDVGKVLPIGSRSMSLQVGAYYNVKKPDGTADWLLRSQFEWDF